MIHLSDDSSTYLVANLVATVATTIITVAGGFLAWVAKTTWDNKRDVHLAHKFIRELKARVEELEKCNLGPHS